MGRIGVWHGALGWAAASAGREVAAEAERLGYGALWVGEGFGGKEIFAQAGTLLAASERLVIASGIANIWARDAVAMKAGGNALGEAYPGRFALGLGVSHKPQIAGRGHDYAKPVATMRAYLDAYDEAPYQAPQPEPPVPTLLAALRPRMLELARERTRGAHPYFVPPEHTAVAREALGPDAFLATEQAVVLETDPATARELARGHMAVYLTLPNYTDNLRLFGFDDDDLAPPGSDRLVDAIVAWGGEDAIRARVQQHLDAGANHVCIQPIAPDRVGLDTLRRLAPALL
jgi:probable F420-dependent oxidoreductase